MTSGEEDTDPLENGPEPVDQTAELPERGRPLPGSWWQRASLPASTVAVFLVFALVLWLNAVVNRYRFNVVLALVGSIPLALLLLRGFLKAHEVPRAPSGH